MPSISIRHRTLELRLRHAFRTADIAFKGLGGAPEPVAAWRDTLVKHAK